MPKLKTKSAAKKRFSFTATGKVKATQANKKHRMRNRSKSTLRRQRGTTILPKAEEKRVRKYLPNG
jgi:large subunit ribosomal protein L35